jgi:hypothetical protein
LKFSLFQDSKYHRKSLSCDAVDLH